MKKRKTLVRVLAIVLAALLVFAAIISAVVSAYAEADTPGTDTCQMSIVLMEEEQALQVTQRLFCTNRTSAHWDRMTFYLYANMFRRESAISYESDVLDAAFPYGYQPAGVEFTSITVNGEPAEWGMEDENELFLTVYFPLEMGESAEIELKYYALYGMNNTFFGTGDTDIRAFGFSPTPAMRATSGELVCNQPVYFARTMFTPKIDYRAEIQLPEGYQLAAGGEVQDLGNSLYSVSVSAHEFAFSASKRWRTYQAETESGMQVTVYSNQRGKASSALDIAVSAVNTLESWFGAFPTQGLTIAQSDAVPDILTADGLILMNSSIIDQGGLTLKKQLWKALAQQYFGYLSYVDPAQDAWLQDALPEYVMYLLYEEEAGSDRYLNLLNEDLLPSLQLTMPGGLKITYASTLFTWTEYRIIVLERGAVVFHELRCAMGRENLIEALRRYAEKGRNAEALGEYDLVDALDEVTGRSWEDFLTDWLFHIDEYKIDQIEWL